MKVPPHLTSGSVEETDESDLDDVMRDTPDPRVLGLAMVKGKDIVTMHYDQVPGPPRTTNSSDPASTGGGCEQLYS